LALSVAVPRLWRRLQLTVKTEQTWNNWNNGKFEKIETLETVRLQINCDNLKA
jgi:hypothetical protein